MSTMLRAALSGTLMAGCGLLAACNSHGGSQANMMAAPGTGTAALPGLPASLPLQGGPATAQAAAPVAARMAAAPRPALRQLADPQAAYAYLDRAASYDDAIGEAPPDYAFGYDGVTPWGWQADDGSVEYAEPIDGGYRYYYYEPGADTPYLVRDPSYSYAFDAAALVAVYDHVGRIVPPGGYGSRWDYAGRFFARARALGEAAQNNRQQVIAANWAARRAQVSAANAAWDAARARDAAWAAYHAQAIGQERAHWQGERDARGQATRQFADYQRRGFQGPVPVTQTHANAPQRLVAAPVSAAPRQAPAVQEQARGAMREANHLAATQPVTGGAPHGAVHHGAEPRAASMRPVAATQPHPARPMPAVVRGGIEERGYAAHASREANQMPRAAAERPITSARRTEAPRAQAEHAIAEPRARAADVPHAMPHVDAPRPTAPRMEPPHAEAARSEAPHAPAAHAAPPPRAAAPAHGAPSGGHDHH